MSATLSPLACPWGRHRDLLNLPARDAASPRRPRGRPGTGRWPLPAAGQRGQPGRRRAGGCGVGAQARCRSLPGPGSRRAVALGLGARELAAAERAGRLLRLRDGVVLLPTAPALAMRALAGLEQPFTTSQARQALGTTRRIAVPLLEHLDSRGWTQRLDAGHRGGALTQGWGVGSSALGDFRESRRRLVGAGGSD